MHDGERRLKSVSANASPIATYGHDGLGRRIRKALPDGTHRKYVYDLDGRIIAERDELNHPVRETIFMDGHPVAEMIGTPGATTIRYIHTDHIGLPRLMTDASGAVIWDAAFMPFGEQVSATGSASTDHRFQGQLADSHASLYYNYFRDYDPTLGRYIQADPIGLDGGLNRYAYVGGNPLSYIDFYGLERCGPRDKCDWARRIRKINQIVYLVCRLLQVDEDSRPQRDRDPPPPPPRPCAHTTDRSS